MYLNFTVAMVTKMDDKIGLILLFGLVGGPKKAP